MAVLSAIPSAAEADARPATDRLPGEAPPCRADLRPSVVDVCHIGNETLH